MSLETEAKFTVSDLVSFNQAKALRELAGFALTDGENVAVTDVYRDTSNRDLLAAGWALRVREKRGHLVATAKRLAKVAQGPIHERDELETALESPRQPFEWPESELRSMVLGVIGRAPLVELFEVRQVRFVRNLIQAEQIVAEMSLDSVHVLAGGREREYLELEIELRPAGSPDELLALVSALGKEMSLVPSARSKFEEGLLLLDGGELPTEPLRRVRARGLRRPRALAAEDELHLEAPSSVTEEDVQAALERLGYRVHARPPREEIRAYFDTQGGDLFKRECVLYFTSHDSRWHFLRGGRQEHVQKGEQNTFAVAGSIGHAVKAITRAMPRVPCLEAVLRETVLALASISGPGVGLSLRVWQLRSPLHAAAPRTALSLALRRRGSSQFELDYLAGLLRKALDLQDLGRSELRFGLLRLGVPLPGAPLPPGFLPTEGDDEAAVCRKILGGEAWRMKANTPGAIQDLDAEFVHDLRVATRRARFACRLFVGVLGVEGRNLLKQELSWIAGLLGRVRDLDVLRTRLESQFALVDADEGFRAAVAGVLDTQAAEARNLLVPALGSERYTALLERMSTAELAAAAARPGKQLGQHRIGKALSRIVPWAQRNPEELSPVEFHRLRILFKRLRYTAEFFHAILAEAAILAKECVTYQDCLGLHQDARVAIEVLHGLAEQPVFREVPAWLLALGALVQVQRDIMQAQRERFRTLWGSVQGLFDLWTSGVLGAGA